MIDNSYGTLAGAVMLTASTEIHIKKDMAYNGKKFVDMRKYIRGKNRETYTKDGVAIPEEKLVEVIEQLTKVAKEKGLIQ